MFEQTFVQGKTRSAWTVTLSLIGELLGVLVLVLIPLIYTDTLPRATLASMLTAPPPPPPPPPPPAAVQPKPVKIAPRQFDAGRLMAPKTIPKQVAMIKEEELPPPSSAVVGGVPGGVPGGTAGGVIGGIVGAVPSAAPPPPPPKAAPKPPQRIRVGGNVQAANLIRKVVPTYPALAKQARIQGTVKFNAVIGKDGTIQNLQLVSGHPLLVQAAQQAVSQWLYKPTLLNGDPVEVVTTIDVNFSLSGG